MREIARNEKSRGKRGKKKRTQSVTETQRDGRRELSKPCSHDFGRRVSSPACVVDTEDLVFVIPAHCHDWRVNNASSAPPPFCSCSQRHLAIKGPGGGLSGGNRPCSSRYCRQFFNMASNSSQNKVPAVHSSNYFLLIYQLVSLCRETCPTLDLDLSLLLCLTAPASRFQS